LLGEEIDKRFSSVRLHAVLVRSIPVSGKK
jgi:hypothetical protein